MSSLETGGIISAMVAAGEINPDRTEVQFRIVWPEQRWVTATWIAMQYNDAKANGQLEPEDEGLTHREEQSQALNRAGLITLSQDRR